MNVVRIALKTNVGRRFQHTLPDLPYDYNALEPHISAEIMQLHHTKHHATYVKNLNELLAKQEDAVASNNVSSLIELQGAIKFNGGGHVNHTLFWTTMTPKGSDLVKGGQIASWIDKNHGSLDKFKTAFSAKAAAVQGSGWCWLGYSKEKKSIEIVTTANQDPCVTAGFIPLLACDVWEHAYYLQYKNVRPDYLKAFWNVVNWKVVEERYQKATK